MPELKVVTQGTAAAVRGEAGNGIGINGISDTGTGQQGLSQTGIGMFGTHGATTGILPGVQGETNSSDPNGAGVVGKNNGGGPGLKSIVTAGTPPLAVNSQVKVQNLNADKLDDLDGSALQRRVNGTCVAGQAIRIVNSDGSVSCEAIGIAGAWSITGNAGTNPATNFLGTTDLTPLELRVNNQRALRLEYDSGHITVIAGLAANAVTPGAIGSTIAGGGGVGAPNLVTDRFGTVGGGVGNVAGDSDVNTATATTATVAGGRENTAAGFEATVGGGFTNTAGGDDATVGGGHTNTASGEFATIAGGNANNATGYASSVGGGTNNSAGGLGSTVAGGSQSSAGGNLSFAAGLRAQANQAGTFVWADSQNADMNTSGADQFIARAQGHFFLQSDSTLDDQNGFINTTTGAFLSTGGTWTNASSRTLKTGFVPVSPVQILEKVAALPLSTWQYKAEPGVRHIGPVAEDFHRAFRVGENSRSIGTVDADGVALAAVQGLYRQNEALKRQNRTLRSQLHAQDARLSRLERVVSRLSR
jgi:hypothetical protein